MNLLGVCFFEIDEYEILNDINNDNIISILILKHYLYTNLIIIT